MPYKDNKKGCDDMTAMLMTATGGDRFGTAQLVADNCNHRDYMVVAICNDGQSQKYTPKGTRPKILQSFLVFLTKAQPSLVRLEGYNK